MKKFATFIFFLAMVSYYQVDAQISIGPKAGINIATLNGFPLGDDDDVDLRYATFLNIGAVAEIPLKDRLFIQPEISFIQKGLLAESEDSSFDDKAVLRLNYLDINALVKYKYLGETVGGYLGIGPYVGYAMSGIVKSEVNVGGTTVETETDLELGEDESGFNRFDFGFTFGGGLVVPIENLPEFFLDVRYLLGITNLNDDDTDDADVSNRGIGITVGALFSL
ncbi:MAG: porin family protein [Bacteroidota bacterium]